MHKKALVFYYDYLFTVSFSSLLKGYNFFTEVKECSQLEDLHTLIEKEKITHLFIDFNRHRKDMISFLKNLASSYKNLYTVVISSVENSGLVYKLRENGVHAFISKNAGSNEIENCLHAIDAGCYYISTDVFNNAVKIKLENKKELFTKREQELLHYIASGKKITDVASLLGLSVHTVVTHRRNMMKKSGVNNMPALIKKAMDMGLI